MPADHPPKPRLTFRVGITGHRPNKLSASSTPRIARQLRTVFETLTAAAGSIYDDNRDFYAPAPATTGEGTSGLPFSMRLISGFAEGADQMAVAAWPAGPDHPIEAILPFPRAEYLKDFEQSAAGDGRDVRGEFLACLTKAAAVTELPAPLGEDRAQAYVTSGSYMLRQIDLLVAVWDGEPPKPGGTGAIVKQAWDGGIPVVWLSTVRDCEPVLVERFEDGAPIASTADWATELLENALPPVFAVPSSERQTRHGTAREGLGQFLQEEWQPASPMRSYDMLERWAAGVRPVRRKLVAEPINKGVARFSKLIDAGPQVNLNARLKDVLALRYVWADTLAVHFSQRYRSAYVLVYFLAAIAVFIALIGLFVGSLHVKAVLVAVELVAIFRIIQVVGHGRDHRWHERWLAYRAIAECLRHGRFLAFVSEFGRIQEGTAAVKIEPPWTMWYIRATMREIGLPAAVLDTDYLRPLLKATLEHEIQDQETYHRRTVGTMKRVDHFLHARGNLCFMLTFAILAAFLGLYVLYLLASIPPVASALQAVMPGIDSGHALYDLLNAAKPVVVFFAAGLPALGAAYAGIRVQGEFESAKERSERMLDDLGTLHADLAAAIARPSVELDEVAKMLIETARVMSEDFTSWQELYGRKRLNLPA